MNNDLNRRDKILTDLYNSGVLQNKLNGIMYRHSIPKKFDIESDIIQETFLHLSRIPAATLIEMYEDNPKRILGLATTIMVRKGVAEHNVTHNPKHSIAQWIMYGSTVKSIIDYTNEKESNLLFSITDDDTELEEILEEHKMWEYIRQNLTQPEQQLLDEILEILTNPKKNKIGIRKKNTKYYRLALKLRIIITKYKNQENTMNELTLQEQISIANRVLPILHAYNQNGQAKAEFEDRQLIKKLYSNITGIFNVDTSCNSCLIHLLNIILSWKCRIDKQNQPEPAPEPEVKESEPVQEEPVQEEPVQEKPVKKTRKKKA